MKEDILVMIRSIIENTKIDNTIIYDILEENEKVYLFDEYKNGDSFSYKILKNYILLKYNAMKKVQDTVEILYLNEESYEEVKQLFDNAQHKDLYVKIGISDIQDINKLKPVLQEIFKKYFIQYMDTQESFGCCSHYIECSNKKECVNQSIRLRFSCQYKKNLDSGRIFYGENKNI